MIQITITLDEIGYSEILDKLAAAGGADPDSPAAALLRYGRQSAALLPERAKEALAVQLLSQNQARLCESAEQLLRQNGIPARVRALHVERVEERKGRYYEV